jgi:hypothetical protein
VNIERVQGDAEEIWPWKIWQADNKQMSEAPAVRFYQPQIVVDQLLKVFEFFAALSEDQTGVPRWAYGNTSIGGAGETSSGLSMLMTHAGRGIKEAIAHLDTMIAGGIERLYDYNMAYDEDPNIKGDARVVARASSSLMAKEQQLVRTREFLQATNNETDMKIIGYDGRAVLLKAAAKALDLPVDDVIPDERKLMERIMAIEQQSAAAMQGVKGSVPPAKAISLDNAGNPAGGTDGNLFQNPEGATPGLRVAGGS